MSNRLSPIALSIFVLALVVSRLPLLSGGFGSDPDSWRNAIAGLHSLDVGHYQPSRVPGFPVFDLIVMALVRGGPLATNGAMLLAGIAAALVFWRVAERAVPGRAALAATAFAFGAPLWVQSGQTMDYALGTCFLLGCYAALIATRPGPAGVLLALAAGCRPSLALVAPAAVLYLAVARAGLGPSARFVLAFAVTLTIVFAPVMLWSGARAAPSDFGFHARRQHVTMDSVIPVLRAAAAFTLGKLGFLVAAAALVVAARRALMGRGLARRTPEPATTARQSVQSNSRSHLPYSVFEMSSVVALLAFYLVIPLDVGYLVPLVPLALLLVFRALPGRGWAAVLALVIASEPLAMPVLVERRVAPGHLLLERAQRRADIAATRAIAAREVADSTVFVLGRFGIQRLMWIRPELERTSLAWSPFYAAGIALRDPARPRAFAAYLASHQVDSLKRAGYDIEFLEAGETP
jgi:hypothetical protein